MSSLSLRSLFVALLAALALVSVEAKPSHPFAFHGIPDHIDALPPLFPHAHFHSAALAPPPAVFSAPLPGPLPLPLAAPAPVFAPAPLSVPAPLPALASAPWAPTLLHAPAPLPAPLPLPLAAPAPVFAPAPLPALALATKVLPPVLEAVPFALPPVPSYRAILGPKTTTHHISVGYAFPNPAPAPVAKLIAPAPLLHSHVHAAPLTLAAAPHLHHHHHSALHHSLF